MNKKPNKSAFIRSLPNETPVEDVIAQAKAAGFDVTDKYIYVIRSKAKLAKGGEKVKGRGRPKGAKPSNVAEQTLSSAEVSFVNAMCRIGLARSKKIVDGLIATT